MASTRKKRQSNKRLLSQLDDFDRDNINGNAASDKQENFVVNEGTVDQEYTVSGTGSNLTAKDKLLIVKTLEVILKGLIGKWVIMLRPSQIGSKTQF